MPSIEKKKKPPRKGVGAYDEALNYLTPKARSVREVEEHLDECDYSETEITAVVERLISAGLLDDARYCRDFIESRLSTKPVSKRKLYEQLKGHKIDDEVIEAALSEVADETEHENALSVARKFARQFSGLPMEERLRRVGLRLAGRGYEFDEIKAVLTIVADEIPEADDGED